MKFARHTLRRTCLAAAAVSLAVAGAGAAGPAEAVGLVVAPGLPVLDLGPEAEDGGRLVGACTAGFSVIDDDGLTKVLTAGHCGDPGDPAVVSGYIVGTFFESHSAPSNEAGESSFEEHITNPDWAVVSLVPEVTLLPSSTDIHPSGVGFATIGDPVCTTGITSGFACGTVIAVYGDYIATDIVRAPGDSGGPLVRSTDGAALGVLSGTASSNFLAEDGTPVHLEASMYFSVPAALAQGNLTLNTEFGPRR